MSRRLLSGAILALSGALGAAAFLAPFFTAAVAQDRMDRAGLASAPLLLSALVGLCFLALLFETQGAALSAKSVALLGILTAINAVLRFVEVIVPGPGGFSPVFMLIILAGYIFGAQFGFLLGAMTLLVSAIITGGIGPWLPYQMFAAGWVGLSAPLGRPLARLAGGGPRAELVLLAGWGALWGFGYGAVMNLWFWPYVSGPTEQYWAPGTGLVETVRRYMTFYALTSLAWDTFGAIGNALLIALFGAPIVRALRRFRTRLAFEYRQ
jgi:energy-coupling factor transport system substrate-specific component